MGENLARGARLSTYLSCSRIPEPLLPFAQLVAGTDYLSITRRGIVGSKILPTDIASNCASVQCELFLVGSRFIHDSYNLLLPPQESSKRRHAVVPKVPLVS